MANNIQVAVKVRPLINREKIENLSSVWTVKDNLIFPIDYPEQQYIFDHIFVAEDSNAEVFAKVAQPIVESAVNGINGTLFAYGQTASGKTYTMMGTKEEPGVIILSIFHIFEQIKNITGRHFLLRVSYLELYNEKLRDLLTNDGKDIKIREDVNGVVISCREEVTNCPNQMLEFMQMGNKNRRIGETNMNERSSRSHTIFRIIIESSPQNPSDDAVLQVSHLNLVDLAGSERANQTFATGARLKEGGHINKSLLALSLVIKYLSEGQDSKTFINYRNSKLTRLLQNSLGGNAMTGIICAITPVALDETHSTLHFASTAKKIKNKPQVNEVLSETTMLKRREQEIAQLKNELELAKSNVSTSDSINQNLMERIKKLEETILLSGTSVNDNSQLANQKTKNRRRTWCPGSSNLSTPYEDFELDLFTDLQLDYQPHIPVSSKIPRKKPPLRISTLSDISECESRPSMELSILNLDQLTEGMDILSPVEEKICCTDDNLVERSFGPSKHDTPCRLKRLLAEKDEEIKEFQALEEFRNQEVIAMMAEVNEVKQSCEKLQNTIMEKDKSIQELNCNLAQFETQMNSATDELTMLKSAHNELLCQVEYKENKFQTREKELLSLLELATKEQNDTQKQLKNEIQSKDACLVQLENSLLILEKKQIELCENISDLESSLEKEKGCNAVLTEIIVEKDRLINQLQDAALNAKDNQLEITKLQEKVTKLEFSLEVERNNNILLEQKVEEKNILLTQFQDNIASSEQKEKEIHELREQLAELDSNFQKSQTLLNEMMEEKNILLTELKDATRIKEENEHLLEKEIQQHNALRLQLEDTVIVLTQKEKLIENLQQQDSILKSTKLDSLNEEIHELHEKLAELDSNFQKSQTLLNEMMEEKNVLLTELKDATRIKEENEHLLEKELQQQNALRLQLEDSVIVLTQKEKLIENLQQQESILNFTKLHSLNEEIHELHEKLTELDSNFQKSQILLNEAIEEKNDLLTKFENATHIIQDKDNIIDQLQAKVTQNEAALQENKNIMLEQDAQDKDLSVLCDSRKLIKEEVDEYKAKVDEYKGQLASSECLLEEEKKQNASIQMQLEHAMVTLAEKGVIIENLQKQDSVLNSTDYNNKLDSSKSSDKSVTDIKPAISRDFQTEELNSASDKNPVNDFISDLESLISIAKEKYEEVSMLLDEFSEKEKNSLHLHEKVKEIQELNIKCQYGCEKLRQELQNNVVKEEVKSGFTRRASVFEDNLKVNNKLFTNLSDGLQNLNNVDSSLHNSKDISLHESETIDEIKKENVFLKSQVRDYKNVVCIVQNDLHMFRKLLMDLKMELEFNQTNRHSSRLTASIKQEIDTTTETSLDSKFLLADNSIGSILDDTVTNDVSLVYSTPKRDWNELNASAPGSFSTPHNGTMNNLLNAHENNLFSINKGLKSELRKIKLRYSEMEKILKEIELKNSSLEINLKKVTQKNHDLENEIETHNQKIQQLNMEFDDLQLQNAELETDIEKLTLANSQLSKELEIAKEKNVLSDNENRGLEQLQNDIFKIDIEKQNLIISELKTEIKSISEKNNDLQMNIKDMKMNYEKDISAKVLLINDLKTKIFSSEESQGRLMQDIDQLHNDLEDLKRNKINLEEQISQITINYNKLRYEYDVVLTEKIDAQNALEEATLGFSSKTINESSIETEMADLNNQIEMLRRTVQDKEEIVKELQLKNIELSDRMELSNKNCDQLRNELISCVRREEYNVVTEEKIKLEHELQKSLESNEVAMRELDEKVNNLEMLRQEKLELLNTFESIKAELTEQNIIAKSELERATSEIQVIRNKMEKEMKGFVKDDSLIVEKLSLVNLYDLIIKHVMEQQIEVFKQMEYKLNKSTEWSKQLESEMSSLADELTTIRNIKESLENDLLLMQEKLQTANLEIQNLKEHGEKDCGHDDIEQALNDLNVQYNELQTKHDSMESYLQIQKHDAENLRKEYENLKQDYNENVIKYKQVCDEHELYVQNTKDQLIKQENDIKDLSEELNNAKTQLMTQSAEAEKSMKRYLDIQHANEEINGKYNKLMNEHKSCKEQVNESLRLSAELKNANNQLIMQEAKLEENLKEHEKLKQTFEELSAKYDVLFVEHKSCNEQSIEYSKLSEKLINIKEKNRVSNQDLVQEIENKYCALLDEHKNCKELEIKMKILQEQTDTLVQDLRSEKSILISKLEEAERKLTENNEDDDKYKKMNNKLNKDIKLLRSKFAELKQEYIKIKEKEFDVESFERENKNLITMKREISSELEAIKMERDNLSKELEQEIEKTKSFLIKKTDMLEKLLDFKPNNHTMKNSWLPIKPNYHQTFGEILTTFIEESNGRKARLLGMEKLIEECERLKTENTTFASNIESLKSAAIDKEHQIKEIKIQLRNSLSELEHYIEKSRKLSKDLEYANSLLSEANKEINDLNGSISLLKKELFRANELSSCLNNKCQSLQEKLKDFQISNERLQDKIQALEKAKQDNYELKLRRRSLHDSSRNINEKIDTADKSSSTEPDGKLTELQLEINYLMSETAKLKREKRSMISDFENKLHETHKINQRLQSEIEIKSAELRNMNTVIQEQNTLVEKRRNYSCVEKCVQTEGLEEENSEIKTKYLRYRQLCKMRMNEIQGLKAQLGLTQNKENNPNHQ